MVGWPVLLNELATAVQLTITIEESRIPVSDPVRGACEVLGLDPLYVANEGTVRDVSSPREHRRGPFYSA